MYFGPLNTKVTLKFEEKNFEHRYLENASIKKFSIVTFVFLIDRFV